MLPSEILIWQPEFTDKTLSRKPGAVQKASPITPEQIEIRELRKKLQRIEMENEILKKATVDSICQCNTPFNYLFRCFELQCLSRSVV
ncbi:transposase [Escherichia coli]|nr:transposase [Escherichia coli]